MLLNPVTYHSPITSKEAAALFSELESVKIQAGGTFLLNSLKAMKVKGAKTPENIIGLNKIPELKGIKIDEDVCVIRAMTTIDDVFNHELPDDLKLLKTVCKNISTQPIRNMATIGGNLTCRYTWTEIPAVMIALDAQLHFIDNNGKEHIQSAEEFFSNQAKSKFLFSHLSFKRNKAIQSSYQRVRKSASVDIPLLSLLLVTEIKNGQFTNTRIGINNCVQFAQRDKRLENFLNGKRAEAGLVDQALANIEEAIYDTRSTDYKSHMFRVSIKKALEEIINND